jgi:hypothetical protein
MLIKFHVQKMIEKLVATVTGIARDTDTFFCQRLSHVGDNACRREQITKSFLKLEEELNSFVFSKL